MNNRAILERQIAAQSKYYGGMLKGSGKNSFSDFYDTVIRSKDSEYTDCAPWAVEYLDAGIIRKILTL